MNLVEALIHRLEEYSANLEDTVEKRTLELLNEKKKSETLLYQILPVCVFLLCFVPFSHTFLKI